MPSSELGATPDLALLDGDASGPAIPGNAMKLSRRELEVLAPIAAGETNKGIARNAMKLSRRELEVLALIAAGETNKGIAAALVISEHTVARHVQNMLAKLGLSSRASLAAFAVRQGLAAAPGGQN